MTEQNFAKSQEKTREELLQKLIERLFSVMKRIHRGVPPQDSTISHAQARLLFIIDSKKEDGVSVKELSEKLSVTPGAITQFVDALVRKDFVRRHEDPNDRRIVRLTLTESAKNQSERLRKEFLSSATRVFDILSDEEMKQLIELLAKVGSSSLPRKCGI